MIYNYFLLESPIKPSDYCRVIYRKTKTCSLNTTCLHGFLYRVNQRGMKILFFTEKVTNNLYAEKNIFEKAGKRLNAACMLILRAKPKHQIVKHLKENPDRKKPS